MYKLTTYTVYYYVLTYTLAYNRDATTELDCIKKQKALYDGQTIDGKETSIDLFMRQLMQFSLLTETKARNIVQGDTI